MSMQIQPPLKENIGKYLWDPLSFFCFLSKDRGVLDSGTTAKPSNCRSGSTLGMFTCCPIMMLLLCHALAGLSNCPHCAVHTAHSYF